MIEILKYIGLVMAAGCGAFMACALYLAGRADREREMLHEDQ